MVTSTRRFWLARGTMILALALAFAAPLSAQDKFIVVASTTSTEDSGLFKYLLPFF